MAAPRFIFCSLFLSIAIVCVESLSFTSPSKPTGARKKVAVVGGGISGLTVSHVLQQSGQYDVILFEKENRLGGNIRSLPEPFSGDVGRCLNVGHATHLGMFFNLRLLLRHLGVEEKPVGRGANDVPGLFRMLSVAISGVRNGPGSHFDGDIVQPPIETITSPAVWWDAFVFYYLSYLEPETRLDEFLERNHFGDEFLDVLYWAMATFEFDKTVDECGDYAIGAARALVITQVFFKYLLCDVFGGKLPPKIDDGLREDLKERAWSGARGGLCSFEEVKKLADVLDGKCGPDKVPLASYFTANYSQLVDNLACVLDNVNTGSEVTRISKRDGGVSFLILETSNGAKTTVDHVVLTIQPNDIANILDADQFSSQCTSLASIDIGAVGVKIVKASNLSFDYPPRKDRPMLPFKRRNPTPILSIFDISELTILSNGAEATGSEAEFKQAGWLSIAYPVYNQEYQNHHRHLLSNVPQLDETVYPWTKATSSFPKARKRLLAIQGVDGVHISGHTFTGVNKASELQVTNALNLCREHFGVQPPWGNFFFPVAMLPDCNDDDAFISTKSPLHALKMALKNMLGSFLLVWVTSFFGVESFE